MTTVFKDVRTVDPMHSHMDSSSRIFGRTVGKTTFGTSSVSQDTNESNVQLRNSNDLENMPDRRSRLPAFGGTTRLQSRFNQDLRTSDCVNVSAASRTFGLQSRNAITVSHPHQEDKLRLNQITDTVNQRNNVSTVSKTFGLISEDLNGGTGQNNQESRINGSINSSIIPRSFGLHTKNLASYSGGFSQYSYRVNSDSNQRSFGLHTKNLASYSGGSSQNNYRINSDTNPRSFGLHTKNLASYSGDSSQYNYRVNPDANVMNYRRSNLSVVSSTYLGSENLGGLISHGNEGFNQNLQRNNSINSTLLRSYGLQSKNLTLNPDTGSKANQDSTLRSNNISAIPNTYGSAVRNAILTTGNNLQDAIDNGGFRRPTVISGRSSTLTSTFQNQHFRRYCKDLSNINGFNVSHISTRDVDTQSDSRLAMNPRSNWMDNQSMSGSIISAASVKSQFMNVLENLHHSILNIGPYVTAEAVRVEFDKAKQRLENISEMSFAPSVRENGAASVISQSSKYICPPIIEPTTSTCIDGGSLHLKSTKDLLKSLISSKDSHKENCNLSTRTEEGGKREKSSSSEKCKPVREDNSELVFKKPGPYVKKRKSPRILKNRTPRAVKNLSVGSNKVINLKQWYPIAVGSDLALCGVDEEGKTVKTDVVKKRLNSRKVELVNGSSCNLIGSPSTMVSVLPKKIMTFLKNGLTDRWRVLQKELLNCQTAEEETKKRVSKSPKVMKSPEKKIKITPEKNTEKKKLRSPTVTSTPKKKVKELHTRSGRAVKPPSMFWIASTGSTEVSSTVQRPTPEITPVKESSKIKSKEISHESPSKKCKKTIKGTPSTKAKATSYGSPRKLKKRSEESHIRGAKSSPNASPRKNKTAAKSVKSPEKAKSAKKKKEKESEEKSEVHSSTEITKRNNKTHTVLGKRKRDVKGDVEFVNAKKSKMEKKTDVEVGSTVQTSQEVSKKEKKRKNEQIVEKEKRLALTGHSGKPEGTKSSPTKKKKTVKKKTVKNTSESKAEMEEVNEFEEDADLKLDDIEIPEIANVSGKPQLSRSQLRLISMETPPLKYFNTHLNLLKSATTPVRTPGWCISQRTESEVKQFQKRREAFNKRIKMDTKKTVITEKNISVQNRDVKKVMEWVAEKTVRSPQWSSKVLQYVIPSRKQLEERMNDEEDEDFETEFL